jgi:hypothetical protein
VVDTVCAEALGLIPVEMKTTFCYYSIFWEEKNLSNHSLPTVYLD